MAGGSWTMPSSPWVTWAWQTNSPWKQDSDSLFPALETHTMNVRPAGILGLVLALALAPRVFASPSVVNNADEAADDRAEALSPSAGSAAGDPAGAVAETASVV